MPLLMTLLAETEAEAGRPEAALAIVDEQLAIAEQTGQRWYLAELHRARGAKSCSSGAPAMKPRRNPPSRVPSTLPKLNQQNCSNCKPRSAWDAYGWRKVDVLTPVNWSHQFALGLIRDPIATPSRKQGY
jgi:hypothetical protein